MVTLPNLIRNFAGAPQADIWYPHALANALTGIELNPGQADCDFIINSNANPGWYYGLDENCPLNQMDFVTEMHKAIPYALGYMTSFYVQTGYGSYGMLDPSVLGLTPSFPWEAMQNQPVLYDTFIHNTSGVFMTDTTSFPNPSPALNAQLTGGNLRYHGFYGMAYNGDIEPELYASAFNHARTARLLGSAYNGTENAPGVPTSESGSIFRYPAPIVMGMLKDQGWTIDLTMYMPAPSPLADVSENNVLLSWEAPDSPYNVVYYKIKWNGELYASTSEDFMSIPNLSSGTHSFTVSAVYHTGESPASEDVIVNIPTAIDDENQSPAAEMSLQLSPNPFKTVLNLNLELKSAGFASIEVYDLRGRKVSQIIGTVLDSGTHSIIWNGTNNEGKKLPAGIYLIRSSSRGSTSIRKICLLP